MAFRRPWRHRHLFLETWIPEGPQRTPESLSAALTASVLALAAVTFPHHRTGSEAGMQGKGGSQPSPHQPVQHQASQLTLSPLFMLYTSTLKGTACPCEGWGVSLSRCRSLNSWAELKGCSCSSGSGGATREDVGHLAFLKVDQCCRKMITASRNPVKAAHHHCCANTSVCASSHTIQSRDTFVVSACFPSHYQLIARSI